MKKIVQIFIIISAILLQFGCSFNAPLKTLYYETAPSATPENLIIFLRGRGGDNNDFAANGLIDDIKNRQLPYDITAPNAHFGYYFGETLVPRLKADIIDPAKAKGYKKIWLVGFSMGGLGSLMYTKEHLEDIDGICIISPFLGYDSILDEISAAGGLHAWEPGDYSEDDWQRMLWDWLQGYAKNEKPLPPVYLGYGSEDPYAPAHKLLGEVLPVEQVFSIPGGHKVEVMKKLWFTFLDKEVLQ